MEALSSLDVNANLKGKQHQEKVKAPPAKALQREKDHPPPPPAEVHEPPCSDRKNGCTYNTGRLLGKGGFAVCYEGQLAGTRSRFALKIVKSHMPQKKMEQKFQTELQIHSKMKHANIVQFHRAFTFQQCTYIVLELCPNGSLMDMVKKRRFLTEPEVRFYTIQVAGAVKYMHAKGIIHRDLKMGNIFLDKDMNVKIGDFGLAALLMSGKDMSACRRTTLCGTPNYIAPEILEKGKKGHDHAVDIWSLGIIIFAMLTGRPPFQSSTQEEIYRKARERAYDWPKINTSENYICQEAKDLVSILLQDPEERPDPDTIVQHPFFSCGWVPQVDEMSPTLRESPPDLNQFGSVGSRSGKTNIYMKNLKKLCMKSEVGPFNTTRKIHTSTYREVAAEEKAGLTPAVPLPSDVVYRPFDEWLTEQALLLAAKPENIPSQREELQIPELPQYRTRPISTSGRPGTQSYAAQQRAQYQPPPISGPNHSQNARTDFDLEAPKQRAILPTKESAITRTAIVLPSRRQKHQPPDQNEKATDPTKNVEARVGSANDQGVSRIQFDLLPHGKGRLQSTKKQASLFSPEENPETLPGTKPDQILKGLQKLQAELERALNSRSVGPLRNVPTANPTIVVKWVDYTNKFGLGYILSNGSVGCIFKASPAHNDPQNGCVPPTCVVIRDAERHLQGRGNTQYADRHQLVPVSGAKIEFYENADEGGISRVMVNPRSFSVTVGPNGEPGKLSKGKDEFDDRKREKIALWKKFANYMTAFGRDQDHPYDEALDRTAAQDHKNTVAVGDVVTFYQRFGDVGCWAFCDGHFQFNFPDHTKIILSADGTWCDFYHLSLEAARDLAETGTLSASALDDRQHLSYPLQALLNFIAKPSRNGKVPVRAPSKINIDPMIQGIPQANDFRAKVEFIRSIIAEWTARGGLGRSDMEPKGRLRWLGHREIVNVKTPYKHVWVTVGARGGDDRRVAWFDPREPATTVPDIES